MTAKNYHRVEDRSLMPYEVNGVPVTITPDQCHAILWALEVYGRVAGANAVFDWRQALDILHFMNAKSALMGRLLYDGLPPLVDCPPTEWARPAWEKYDEDAEDNNV